MFRFVDREETTGRQIEIFETADNNDVENIELQTIVHGRNASKSTEDNKVLEAFWKDDPVGR